MKLIRPAISCMLAVSADAFLAPGSHYLPSDQINSMSSTSLYGAFNKGNKQAELMKKMADAKKQREIEASGDVAPIVQPSEDKKLSDAEVKKMNDMKRFEQLLGSESTTMNYDIDGNNYKTQQQEEEELDATSRGVNRMFEGDPAPSEPFEDLVNMVTGNAMGENGAKRIVPWLKTSSAKQKDYLIVITDPRAKSSELRSTLIRISKGLPADVLSKLVVINADTPAENRRYLKKNGIDNVHMLCDEKREWMREYTVLGENRWSMCLLVLQEKRVEKLVREVDVELVTKVIKAATQKL